MVLIVLHYTQTFHLFYGLFTKIIQNSKSVIKKHFLFSSRIVMVSLHTQWKVSVSNYHTMNDDDDERTLKYTFQHLYPLPFSRFLFKFNVLVTTVCKNKCVNRLKWRGKEYVTLITMCIQTQYKRRGPFSWNLIFSLFFVCALFWEKTWKIHNMLMIVQVCLCGAYYPFTLGTCVSTRVRKDVPKGGKSIDKKRRET